MKIKFLAIDRDNGLVTKMDFSVRGLAITEEQLDLNNIKKNWSYRTLRFEGRAAERIKALSDLIEQWEEGQYSRNSLIEALFYTLREFSGDECTYEHVEFEIKG